MILCLKTWESRSPPGLQTYVTVASRRLSVVSKVILTTESRQPKTDAGWSSPVARQAHNLKVVGSNPTPATRFIEQDERTSPPLAGFSVRAEPFAAMTKENRFRPMS